MKTMLLSLTTVAIITSCGAKSSVSSEKSLTRAIENDSGRTKYTVEALVINEGSKPVVVALLNNGPHGGGCDSKNYVPFSIDSKSLKTVSDTWYCETDQKFSILVKHPNGALQIDGVSANVICSDDGCRQLDVK
jgi:hypothetical protein